MALANSIQIVLFDFPKFKMLLQTESRAQQDAQVSSLSTAIPRLLKKRISFAIHLFLKTNLSGFTPTPKSLGC